MQLSDPLGLDFQMVVSCYVYAGALGQQGKSGKALSDL